jgi:hypothetical protein
MVLNTFNFFGSPSVGHMRAQADGWLQRFFKIVYMCWDRKRFAKRHKRFAGFEIFNLCKTISKFAKRAAHLARRSLVTVFAITHRVFVNISLHSFDLDGLKQAGNDSLMDLKRIFFNSMNQTIDRQFRTWYLKHQAKVDCDLAQRVPPFFFCFGELKKRGIRFIFQALNVQLHNIDDVKG